MESCSSAPKTAVCAAVLFLLGSMRRYAAAGGVCATRTTDVGGGGVVDDGQQSASDAARTDRRKPQQGSQRPRWLMALMWLIAPMWPTGGTHAAAGHSPTGRLAGHLAAGQVATGICATGHAAAHAAAHAGHVEMTANKNRYGQNAFFKKASVASAAAMPAGLSGRKGDDWGRLDVLHDEDSPILRKCTGGCINFHGAMREEASARNFHITFSHDYGTIEDGLGVVMGRSTVPGLAALAVTLVLLYHKRPGTGRSKSICERRAHKRAQRHGHA